MESDAFRKVYWKDIREKVQQVNPILAKIIDDLAPAENLPLYHARYPYGAEITRSGVFQLPSSQGKQLIPLADPSVSNTIKEDLSYNKGCHPAGVMLSKSIEFSLPLEDHVVTILSGLVKPGQVFSLGRVLGSKIPLQPAFLWNVTAGASSIFTLPKIANSTGYAELSRHFGVNPQKPRNIFEHWNVFREIAQTKVEQEKEDKWNAELIYFSASWFSHIKDPVWRDFHNYMLCAHQKVSELLSTQQVQNLVFSLIQKNLNIKPDGYLLDTVKHLVNLAAGSACGFSPAQNDDNAPIKLLQHALVNVYQLRDYVPTIMQPATFNQYDEDPVPIYYSLRYPNLIDFSPKSSESNSFITGLYHIISLLKKCLDELRYGGLNLEETPLFDITKNAAFDFYHIKSQGYREISSIDDLPMLDPRFIKTQEEFSSNKVFAINASFLKGCMKIHTTSTT